MTSGYYTDIAKSKASQTRIALANPSSEREIEITFLIYNHGEELDYRTVSGVRYFYANDETKQSLLIYKAGDVNPIPYTDFKLIIFEDYKSSVYFPANTFMENTEIRITRSQIPFKDGYTPKNAPIKPTQINTAFAGLTMSAQENYRRTESSVRIAENVSDADASGGEMRIFEPASKRINGTICFDDTGKKVIIRNPSDQAKNIARADGETSQEGTLSNQSQKVSGAKMVTSISVGSPTQTEDDVIAADGNWNEMEYRISADHTGGNILVSGKTGVVLQSSNSPVLTVDASKVDVHGKLVKNVADPVDGNDAVNFDTLKAAMTDEVIDYIPDASPTERGLVNTEAQSFAGEKTILNGMRIESPSRLTFPATGGEKIALFEDLSVGKEWHKCSIDVNNSGIEFVLPTDSWSVRCYNRTDQAPATMHFKTQPAGTEDTSGATTEFVAKAIVDSGAIAGLIVFDGLTQTEYTGIKRFRLLNYYRDLVYDAALNSIEIVIPSLTVEEGTKVGAEVSIDRVTKIKTYGDIILQAGGALQPFEANLTVPFRVSKDGDGVVVNENTVSVKYEGDGVTVAKDPTDPTQTVVTMSGLQGLNYPIDALNYRIIKVGDPVDPTDAINKGSAEAYADAKDAAILTEVTELQTTVDKIQRYFAFTAANGTTWYKIFQATTNVTEGSAYRISLNLKRSSGQGAYGFVFDFWRGYNGAYDAKIISSDYKDTLCQPRVVVKNNEVWIAGGYTSGSSAVDFSVQSYSTVVGWEIGNLATATTQPAGTLLAFATNEVVTAAYVADSLEPIIISSADAPPKIVIAGAGSTSGIFTMVKIGKYVFINAPDVYLDVSTTSTITLTDPRFLPRASMVSPAIVGIPAGNPSDYKPARFTMSSYTAGVSCVWQSVFDSYTGSRYTTFSGQWVTD